MPFYPDRLDISSLDDTNDNFDRSFTTQLLSGQLTIQANTDGLAAEKLRHIYFESRNFEKSYGAKSFGFGYPLIVDTFSGELLVSPLFIWLLNIEPAQTKVDSWVFKHGEQQFVVPNYQVVKYLKEKYDYDVKERLEEIALGRKLSQEMLDTFCNELAERLELVQKGDSEHIIPSPGIDEIGPLAEQRVLFWSGVMSLFPPQFISWKSGEYKPEETLNPEALTSEEEAFVFPFLPADPEQSAALELISRQKISIVEGDDALGKTQTMVNLLINALSNGKKSLVVSERTPTLKYSQAMLAQTGLNQLNFLLDDALYDKMPLLELLRVAAGGTTREIPHNEEDFLIKKNKYLRDKQKADRAYAARSFKAFGQYNWTETTGLFLASNRVEGKELLTSQLNAQDFVFTVEEYDKLKSGILSCHPLFVQVKTLTHPLSNLHDDIFTKNKPVEGLKFVKTQLREFLGKLGQLQHRYITKVDAYAARLNEHYNEHHSLLHAECNKLKEKLLHYGDELGNDFRQAGARKVSFSFFSSKKKKVNRAREEVALLYKGLLKDYSDHKYFEFEFEPCKDGMHIPKLTGNLNRFEEALTRWGNKIEVATQEEVNRLNSKTAHPNLDLKEQISDLEYSLDVLLEELNDANLYQKKFENKTLTIPQRQKYLESVVEQLETTQLNLRDFELFYQWQANWLKLGNLDQKVVRALVKVKPIDWMAAFESWYFGNLLAKLQSSDLPTEESLVENYSSNWFALRPLIFNQLWKLWQTRQIANLKKLKRDNRKAWHYIFERSGHAEAESLPLSEILEPAFDTVSAFLPILFVSSHVALNVLPRLNGYFDYVIFDEANKFSVEHAAAIAPLGKKVAVFGSDDSYGNETSLIQYALENEVPSAPITNLYFPPAQTGIAENPVNQIEYFIENVEGRFSDAEEFNDVEAQHVVRQLQEIKETPQRVYPSVGVVTLTIGQRDLISGYLLKLKQQNDEGSDKIRQLERNGLAVLFIDELFGQQFDQIILSCTYGMVNLKGTMTKKLISLNSLEGISYINMLANKPAQKLHIIHSFPDEAIEGYLNKKWDKGTWLLGHLIRLAEARASHDEAQINECMEVLGKNVAIEKERSVFAQELANALTPYMEKNRLTRQIQMDDIQLPLIIQPIHHSGAPVVVHPDGFFADTEYTSHLWEFKRREKIKSNGLDYLPVWSVQWLKNPSQEARLLASKIIKSDARFKPTQLQHPTKELSESGDAKED